jgi:hypothetical protein
MKGDVDHKIDEIKQEVTSSKTEITEIKETLQSTNLLQLLLKKMDNVSVTTVNIQPDSKYTDVEMTDAKQHVGV